MKFKTGNADINMTSLQGYINTSYDDLVACFGEPTSDGDGYKVDAEWELTFEDGTVATIYNWKDGHNYCGEDGMPVECITDWHIGGRSGRAVSHVHSAMDAHLKATCYQEPKEIAYFGA